MYALEAHVTYEREVKEGDELSISTQLIDADSRRLHFFHRMHHTEQDYLAATIEHLALHVDLAGPRAAPFPADAAAAIATMLAMHRRLPRPPQLGRSIGLGNKRAQ
jgi:acyl-CoA thioester hydrolase